MERNGARRIAFVAASTLSVAYAALVFPMFLHLEAIPFHLGSFALLALIWIAAFRRKWHFHLGHFLVTSVVIMLVGLGWFRLNHAEELMMTELRKLRYERIGPKNPDETWREVLLGLKPGWGQAAVVVGRELGLGANGLFNHLGREAWPGWGAGTYEYDFIGRTRYLLEQERELWVKAKAYRHVVLDHLKITTRR